jgi:protein-S-isoprenylcysteine O-methyltransferase Ste14
MLTVRSLAAAGIIAGIWFVGFPYFLVAAEAEVFPIELGRLRWIGVLPLLAGAGMFSWVTWAFAAAGRGTPLIFDPPKRFVTSGLYGRVRNPMYVADILIIVGIAILVESSAILAYGGLLWLGLHMLVVFLEEPRLRKKFGASYEEYCGRVPRWIPRRAVVKPGC